MFFAEHHHKTPEPEAYRIRHTHSLNELVIFTEGTGEILNPDGTSETAISPAAYYYPAGVAHNSWCGAGQSMHASVVLFGEEFTNNDLSGKLKNAIGALEQAARKEKSFLLPLSNEPIHKIHAKTTELTKLQAKQTPWNDLERRILLESLLLTVVQALAAKGKSTSQYEAAEDSVRRVILWMKRNLHHPVSINDALEIVPMSRSKFFYAFRKHTGKSFHRLLLEFRLDYALNLIKNTDKPISRIALLAGFNGQSHFTAYFSKTFGTSPAKYRKNN